MSIKHLLGAGLAEGGSGARYGGRALGTFAEILRSRVDDEHVGLRFEDEAWTWAQVVQECADRASVISSLAAPGRQLHVGVLLENVPDYIFWIGAASLAGAALVGINSTRRGEELAHDVRHTDCDVIITEERLVGLLEGLDLGVPDARVFNIDDPAYGELISAHRGSPLPADVPAAESPLLLQFSSGSTGAPKAVICSQGRFGTLAHTLAERSGLTRDSVTYLCMPLFHGNSTMMNFAPATKAGATVVLARKFSASGFARDVHRYGVTFVNYVGRALSYVLAQPETEQDRRSTLVLAAGTEASVADAERFSARFGCEVSEGYGSSEGVLRIRRTPDTPAGALGLPVAGADVRVVNQETGQECPPADIDGHGRLRNSDEAIGEIVGVGLAHKFEGYYKNPGAEAERVRGADFWTGDLAYRDHEGFFYFAGRSSDWLRVDSENFSAAPIERVLERWERVEVAVVYAVPDPRTGDQVMCTLQMRPGMEFEPAAFAEHLDRQADMGTKWRPRFVRVTQEVPTTGSNKVAKPVLRRAGWRTTDPVFWRPERESGFELMDDAAKTQLEQEFIRNRRGALLPA